MNGIELSLVWIAFWVAVWCMKHITPPIVFITAISAGAVSCLKRGL